MVPSRQQQAAVMVEAVRGNKPQVVLIDEMGTQEVSLSAYGRNGMEEWRQKGLGAVDRRGATGSY
jgi:stage III sporulation protein SpoIIIAA